ncbi:hypothetical protein, partial [Nocardioides malaquae]|uniref:hypothetical protein n=1 Tax=Nocardioides malaquae TaxID=2773426 RepID=UPI001D0D15F6
RSDLLLFCGKKKKKKKNGQIYDLYSQEDPSWSSDRLSASEIVEWGLKLTQGMCWFAFFPLVFSIANT